MLSSVYLIILLLISNPNPFNISAFLNQNSLLRRLIGWVSRSLLKLRGPPRLPANYFEALLYRLLGHFIHIPRLALRFARFVALEIFWMVHINRLALIQTVSGITILFINDIPYPISNRANCIRLPSHLKLLHHYMLDNLRHLIRLLCFLVLSNCCILRWVLLRYSD